jgi:hypothetical protein
MVRWYGKAFLAFGALASLLVTSGAGLRWGSLGGLLHGLL